MAFYYFLFDGLQMKAFDRDSKPNGHASLINYKDLLSVGETLKNINFEKKNQVFKN